MARGVQFPDIYDPMAVELLVLREAIVCCLDLGLTEVCFAGNTKVVIDKINGADTRDSLTRIILEEVVRIFMCDL
ncbi:unnamed protein product [Linum trigynum]|uniref:RNase H type-1 domain-containing protein n=1 Tax=Linum trigynum TaxID=586398 RepID=A0AAV2FFL2_9ROSI